MEALPLVASTVTCEPLHPVNVLCAAGIVGRHALRAFRSSTLVVKRTSRHRHRSAASPTEAAGTDTSRHSAVSSHHTRHTRRSHSADDSLQSAHSVGRGASAAGSTRRSRSTGDAETRSRSHRSRSASNEAVKKAGDSARGSPALPPLRPPPPPPAVASLGGLTASRLHSNNSSFNSLHGAQPPMTGKPPLSGQRSGATPRGASAEGSRRHDRTRDSASSSTHRHHRRSSSDGAGGGVDSRGGEAPAHQERESRRTSSRHRERTSSRDSHSSRRGHDDDDASGVEVIAPTRPRRPLRQRMAEWDVTAWVRGVTHFVRAFPAKLVHAYSGLQRQLVALPLLHFRDEGDRLHALLDDVIPRPGESLEQVSQLFLNPVMGVHCLALREVLRACGAYVAECVMLDNSLAIKLLRSRRTSRRTLGWVIRLGAHAIVDPLFLSAVTPLLLVKLRDVEQGAELAQQLHVTVAGAVRGLAVGAASVLLERVLMPSLSRLVNRAVVTCCESTEYVLLRRYHTWPESSADDEDDNDNNDDDNDGNEDDTSVAVDAQRSRDDSAVGAADRSRGADANERLRRRARREKRKRREAREAAEVAAMNRAMLRAIAYRVLGSLTAQCLVEHPVMMAVEVLRGRALMHAAGLLRMYDPPVSTVAPLAAVVDAPATPTFWSTLFGPDAHTATTSVVASADADTAALGDDGGSQVRAVPPVVDSLRRVGREIGGECRALLDTLTDAAGQTDAIAALLLAARAETEAGQRPDARQSVELFARCVMTAAPLFAALQITVVDRLVTFYVEVWTRLTK